MNAEKFSYWLQGFVELTDGQHPTERQWAIIKDHLQLVFTKVTPVRDAQGRFPDQTREVGIGAQPYVQPIYEDKKSVGKDPAAKDPEAKQPDMKIEPAVMKPNEFDELIKKLNEQQKRNPNRAAPYMPQPHPQWIPRDAKGDPMVAPYWYPPTQPGLVITC